MKIYQLCDSKRYTYNMTAYLGKDREHVTATMTATYVIVTKLTARIENVGYNVFMDNPFSSPESYDDLLTKTINCCQTKLEANSWGLFKETENETW
jgi:hypothetical protein